MQRAPGRHAGQPMMARISLARLNLTAGGLRHPGLHGCGRPPLQRGESNHVCGDVPGAGHLWGRPFSLDNLIIADMLKALIG
jgi:hypothetical protein